TDRNAFGLVELCHRRRVECSARRVRKAMAGNMLHRGDGIDPTTTETVRDDHGRRRHKTRQRIQREWIERGVVDDPSVRKPRSVRPRQPHRGDGPVIPPPPLRPSKNTSG
ncbi:MAG: hypothetical protein RLZZ244_2282, partial [Verrucomicrobiota bacterium]